MLGAPDAARLSSRWRNLVMVGGLAAALYGVSYQQFRHFDLSDPRGVQDSASYVRMSHGDYRVDAVHRYRFLVPGAVALLRPVVQRVVKDPGEADQLGFYAVNYACSLAAAWFLLQLLLALRFPLGSALLGAGMFITSRITVLVTGTPLVDAPFLAAVALVAYLAITGRVLWLTVLLPLLMLTKETMALVALLPLLVPAFRRSRYVVSLAGSLALSYAARYAIDGLVGAGAAAATPSLWAIVLRHCGYMGGNLAELLTLRGLHSLQNGYGFFLVFAVLGFLLNRRRHLMRDHAVLLGLVPVSLLFAFVSGDLGRMFFTAFPVVIPYALLFVQEALGLPSGFATTSRSTR